MVTGWGFNSWPFFFENLSNFGAELGIYSKDTIMKGQSQITPDNTQEYMLGLKRMFVKVSLDEKFYAHHLLNFAWRNRLSWPDMVHLFQTTERNLFLLGLCIWSTEERAINHVSDQMELPVMRKNIFKRIFYGLGPEAQKDFIK